MGRDSMSVVDGELKVYGVDGIRIADGSVLPRVSTANTMAPCVIVGEHAVEILSAPYDLSAPVRSQP
jgi:choline dehydrogenase